MTMECNREVSQSINIGDKKKCRPSRGWIIVFACFGINTLILGYIKCFGILFVEFVEEFHATASMTSLVMGLTSASTSIMSLIVLNVLMDRLTIRKLALAGAASVSAGVLLSSRAVNIEFLLFSQSFLVGSAQGLMYGPGIVLIGQYFDKRRTLATAIATSGVSAGAILVPLLLRYLLDQYSLRGALLILGAVMMETFVFAALYSVPDHVEFAHNTHNEQCNKNGKSTDSELETSGFEESDCPCYDDLENCQEEDNNDSLLDESGTMLESQYEKCSDYHDVPTNGNVSCKVYNNRDLVRVIQEEIKYHKGIQNIGNTTDSSSYQSLRLNCDPSRNTNACTLKYASHADSICLSTFSLPTSATEEATTNCTTGKDTNCFVSVLRTNLILFKNPRFLIIFGVTFFGIIGTCLFPAFIPPLANEIGLTDVQAALLISLFACMDLISRLTSGFIAELPVVNRRYMLVTMFLILGIIYQFTPYYTDFQLMIMFVVLFGLINGVYAALHPPLILDFLGRERFSKVFGFVQVFHGAALSASFPILGYLRDLTGTYTTSFHVLGASQFVAAVFLVLEPLTRRGG